MVKDDQNYSGLERTFSETEGQAGSGVRGAGLKLAALALTVITVAAATGFLMVHLLQNVEADPGGGDNQTPAQARDRPRQVLFKDWPRPDFVLVLSAQQHGHLQECGCTVPQRGGLVRRYNVIKDLKKRGWNVVAVDLGDIAQRQGPQSLPNIQGLIKYKYSMLALKEMEYVGVGVGEYEMGLPLFPALGEFTLENARPRVMAANLIDKNTEYPGDPKHYADRKASLVGDWQVETVRLGDKEMKVGIVGVVGPSVAKQVQNQGVKFANNNATLPAVLKDLDDNGKPDFRVLLYQGSMSGKKSEAEACAEKYPQFQVVLALSEEDEPSAQEKRAGNTYIIGVGQKGKYVGVVGVNRTGDAKQPFALRYQLVPLDPEFATPANEEEGHPMMKLMEQYAREVKKEKLIERYVLGKHRVQVEFPGSTYVGSDACQKCHGPEHGVWKDVMDKKYSHSHAYKKLVTAAKPSLRQHDGECAVCHTVGFGYDTGFNGDETKTHLLNVGCESCHGPASKHVEDPKNVALRNALNTWKRQPGEPDDTKRIARIDQFCQKCHDIENDVHWKGLKEKWEKGIDHCFRNPLVWPKK